MSKPTWAEVQFETAFGILGLTVGLATGVTYCFYVAGTLFFFAFLDAWSILRPPKRDGGLRRYAKDVFDGKIDPEKDDK